LILQIYTACDYQRESTLKSLKCLNFWLCFSFIKNL
jgi:hypothetical protein